MRISERTFTCLVFMYCTNKFLRVAQMIVPSMYTTKNKKICLMASDNELAR